MSIAHLHQIICWHLHAFTLTGAAAAFGKQTGLLAGFVIESGGMIAAVTAVRSSDVPSGLLVADDDFSSETVRIVVSGFVVTPSGLLNSVPQRLEWCFCLQDLQRNFNVHCETL